MDSIYKNAKMSYKPIIELLNSFEFIFDFSKGQAIQVRNDLFYFTKQHARSTIAPLFRVTNNNISLSKD